MTHCAWDMYLQDRNEQQVTYMSKRSYRQAKLCCYISNCACMVACNRHLFDFARGCKKVLLSMDSKKQVHTYRHLFDIGSPEGEYS